MDVFGIDTIARAAFAFRDRAFGFGPTNFVVTPGAM
jgi:hypothetical protein